MLINKNMSIIKRTIQIPNGFNFDFLSIVLMIIDRIQSTRQSRTFGLPKISYHLASITMEKWPRACPIRANRRANT